MAECGWFVLFQQEVTGPGKPVTNRKEQQSVPRMPQNQRTQYHEHAKRRADSMQDPVTRVAMLLEVETEELVIRLELVWLGHRVSPPRALGNKLKRATSLLREAEVVAIRYYLLQLLQRRDGFCNESWHLDWRRGLSWPECCDPGGSAQRNSALRR